MTPRRSSNKVRVGQKIYYSKLNGLISLTWHVEGALCLPCNGLVRPFAKLLNQGKLKTGRDQ